MRANGSSRHTAATPDPRLKKPLLDFIPAITPSRLGREVVAPVWLKPITDLFERIAAGEQVRAVINCPPQHGKTMAVEHGLIWLAAHRPELSYAYVAYNWDRAKAVAQESRFIASRAGLLSHRDGTMDAWPLPRGGSVKWVGIGGGLTGFSVNVLITDDTIKDRVHAESVAIRDKTWGWYQGVAFDRLQKGASIIHVETRWHTDDVTGRMLAQARHDPDAYQFEHIRLPAIDEDGRPLAPYLFDTDSLAAKQASVGPYEWAAKYQGDPRPRGQELFSGAVYYDQLPTRAEGGYRVAVGVDLAYTAKTRADYSVALVLARGADDRYYVVDVQRRQVKAPDFAATLRQLQSEYPGAQMPWYAAGTEKGSADFLVESGIRLQVWPATADKFVRAQPVSAAWQAGKILVPRDKPWVQMFLDEVLTFTGAGDVHDDQVDALAAAFDALQVYDSLTGGGAKAPRRRTLGLGDEWTGPVGWGN